MGVLEIGGMGEEFVLVDKIVDISGCRSISYDISGPKCTFRPYKIYYLTNVVEEAIRRKAQAAPKPQLSTLTPYGTV